MNNIGLNHQILVNELRRIAIVGMNTANFCRCQVDLCGLFTLKKCPNRRLTSEVKLSMRSEQQIPGVQPLGKEVTHNGRTNHSLMTGNVYSIMHKDPTIQDV